MNSDGKGCSIKNRGEETNMPHGKNVIHVSAHIVLSVLTVLPFVVCFLFYNSASLEVLLYVGWISLAVGVILFSMSHIYLHKKGVKWRRKKVILIPQFSLTVAFTP